ncbi:hypothetical protein [Tessaracoccus sp. G1721]
MRSAILAVGAVVVVSGLTSCTGAAQTPLQPTAGQTTPAASPMPSTTAAPAESAQPAPDPEPSLELAPTASLSPVEQPTPEGGPWSAVAASLSSPEQARAQAGLPASFQEFLGVRLGYADETGCVTTQVDVRAVHRDGFVFGEEQTTCGDSLTVWGITEQRWHYIVAFQDAMPCADLTQNGVPTGVPGLRCLDANGAATDY